MSANKMVVPGFGSGAAFGVPSTVAVTNGTTYTVSVGQWYIAGLIADMNVQIYDNVASDAIRVTSGYTGGGGGFYFSDGKSVQVVNNSEGTLNITLISVNCW